MNKPIFFFFLLNYLHTNQQVDTWNNMSVTGRGRGEHMADGIGATSPRLILMGGFGGKKVYPS